MSGKQAIIVIICIVVIGAAIYLTVRRQSGPADTPTRIVQQEKDYMCAKCGAEVTMPVSEWIKLKVDPETGYKKCPECGEFGLNPSMTCPLCGEKIPKQMPQAEPTDPHICPKCDKEIPKIDMVPGEEMLQDAEGMTPPEDAEE